MNQLKETHSRLIRTGRVSDPQEQARLISFTCTHESGNMDYARLLFDQIQDPSVFIWNTMIRGYSFRNSPESAASVYLEMLHRGIKPDRYTFPFMLKSFTRYNRSKRFDESCWLFGEMEKANVAPTPVTLVLVLSACTKLKDLSLGKRVHQYIYDNRIEINLILGNALLDLYATCGDMDITLALFENMKVTDMVLNVGDNMRWDDKSFGKVGSRAEAPDPLSCYWSSTAEEPASSTSK
ncbi:hypothetical protein ACLOJK_019989 [Asimina triloba]